MPIDGQPLTKTEAALRSIRARIHSGDLAAARDRDLDRRREPRARLPGVAMQDAADCQRIEEKVDGMDMNEIGIAETRRVQGLGARRQVDDVRR